VGRQAEKPAIRIDLRLWVICSKPLFSAKNMRLQALGRRFSAKKAGKQAKIP
jgi:hypothetical protein